MTNNNNLKRSALSRPHNVLPPAPPPPSSPPRADRNANPRHSIWSTSQASELPQLLVSRARRSNSGAERPTTAIRPSNHQRAYSCSTIDTQPFQTGNNRNTFKIVIDRSESTRPRSAQRPNEGSDAFPVLEVPIPHWRLGSPQFTDQGTPVLRSSLYTVTRASESQHPRSSRFLSGEFDKLFPIPPPAMRQLHSTTDSYIFPSSMILPTRHHSTYTAVSGVTGSSAALPSPSPQRYEIAGPIEPEIFDVMAVNMDDPAVVRYAQQSKDIIAATPARIVAEISSENFMDYELVSDFFLTFRAYITTYSLLSLLLARLHWAINRLQDDGRIIRIRTFAALRHWILNYFNDDFASDLQVRVHFCDKINAMYKEVKARTGGGVSDLKILLDLKKCWNGKSASHWDAPDFFVEIKPDDDIVPGGLDEDGQALRTECLAEEPQSTFVADSTPEPKAAMQSWLEERPDTPTQQTHRHGRQTSNSTTNSVTLSPASELSIQPFSCSLPSLRKTSPSRKTHHNHPVPVASVHPTTASSAPPPSMVWRRPAHSHKRSGSFTDSIRDDRTPLPVLKVDNQDDDFMFVAADMGSLIRGHVFQPGHPFVEMMAPPSPFDGGQFTHVKHGENGIEHFRSPASGGSPAVKSIIGSIRRALSTRQAHGVQRHPGTARSKNSMFSLSVHGPGELARDKRPIGFKNRMRIDLLCAQVAQSYEAMLKLGEEDVQQTQPVRKNGAHGDTFDHAFFESPGNDRNSLNPRRMQSGFTMGSQSVVIVDDTRPDMPVMAGGLKTLGSAAHISDRGDGIDSERLEAEGSYPIDTRVARRDTIDTDHSAGIRASWRSSSVDRGRRSPRISLAERENSTRSASTHASRALGSKNRKSIATTLRKYASYQSTIARNRSTMMMENPTLYSPTIANENLDASFEPPKSRILRRRPGGDLRNVTNVQDLEVDLRHESGGSFTTAADSMVGSALFMAKTRAAGAPMSPTTQTSSIEAETVPNGRPQPKKISMINTHSARPLRPSFEAAVKAFARIPDDEDGGVDSTLLKLEGKYIAPPSLIRKSPSREDSVVELSTNADVDDGFEDGDVRWSEAMGDMQSVAFESEQSLPIQAPLDQRQDDRLQVKVRSIAVSDLSDCSIPLLERGLIESSGFRSESTGRVAGQVEVAESSHPSIEMVDETESVKMAGLDSTPKAAQDSSFLLDEGKENDFSDLSSELSVDIIDPREVEENSNRYPSPLLAAPGTAVSGIALPTHPLAHPPSPPMTVPNTVANTPATQVNMTSFQDKPLTPEPSPTHLKVTLAEPVRPAQTRITANDGHVAFILACSSEVLAQQFTLVEKAALAEVDWKDLVDMKWKSSTPAVLNWVDVIQIPDLSGLDLAIARFNIMVKWVLSEIVLTQDIHERAATITKFIHVARECRRIRNYATMLQIVIALSSRDCASLGRTWSFVNDIDKEVLRGMESLVQPVRNFADLRMEMESTDLQEGCIPFVGLYVHDLTYNAQKPAQFPSPARASFSPFKTSTKTEPGQLLVNFERYRTAATIVKSLLRLIDASSKYEFESVPGVVERCLWMGTLSEERIAALRSVLE